MIIHEIRSRKNLITDSYVIKCASKCVQYLLKPHSDVGLWMMPEGVEGICLEVATGVEHQAVVDLRQEQQSCI